MLRAWQPLLADVISFGYAIVVAAVVLTQDLTLGWGEATAILVLYVLLRGAARDVRRSYRRVGAAASGQR